MVRPGGDVLSLRAYVQLPQHVSDELLYVLMATVVEGDARALSVGQWCGGHDPIRVDDDGLIVRLRKLHECHERSILVIRRASRARRPETCDARASRSSLCTENVKARRFKWLAAIAAHPAAPPYRLIPAAGPELKKLKILHMSAVGGIVLQNSQMAQRPISRQRTKRSTIANQ
jgi:hypothetical protein